MLKECKDILAQIGWPIDTLVIDFETYFDRDYSLTKMSTIEYIMDNRFELLGIGFNWEDNSSVAACNESLALQSLGFWGKPYLEKNSGVDFHIIDFFKFCLGPNLEKCTVIVKNAKFDITVLVEKFGINPPYVVDVDDLLRYYDARMSHRMKDITAMFKLQEKGNTKEFLGLHYDNMDGIQKNHLAKYCKNDVGIETELFKILLPKLPNPEIELAIARHSLDLYLKPEIKFDFLKAIQLDMDMEMLLYNLVKPTGYSIKEMGGTLSFTKILKNALPRHRGFPIKPGKPGKNMKLLLGKSGFIPALAKDDQEFQELLVHPNSHIRNLCLARQAVKSFPLHRKRVNRMMAQAQASKGFMRVPINYCGAHTHRWTGGENINLLNLGGRGRTGKGIHQLISGIRELLRAPEGNTFLIVDAAQIEARLLAWIAGQKDLVSGFANGEDIYSQFASDLFGCEVHKPRENESEEVQKEMKIKRGFGKDSILGCGYGLGADTFYKRCMSNEDLQPLFDSGKYNMSFVRTLINTYRGKYSCIPDFWDTVEKLFRYVTRYPDKKASYLSGTLRFWNDRGTVNLQLPSGSVLTYRNATAGRGRSIRHRYGALWGGSITENIIQSISRDLLVYWILESEKIGIHIVYHCYDEVVGIVKKELAEEKREELLAIMSAGPKWVKNCPLAAEAILSDIYTK